MVQIFNFWPTSLVFEIVNPFPWIFNVMSSDKSCLISTWRQDTRIFPACWILIGQFKFPARQPYARTSLSLLIISPRSLHVNFWNFPRYANRRCASHARFAKVEQLKDDSPFVLIGRVFHPSEIQALCLKSATCLYFKAGGVTGLHGEGIGRQKLTVPFSSPNS